MKFAQWLKLNETSLSSMLNPVPQNPKHHYEGSAGVHSRLVRVQLNSAIQHFQELVQTNPIFSNFSPQLTKDEINLLRISSHLHDIGKVSATTIDGQPWQNAVKTLNILNQ